MWDAIMAIGILTVIGTTLLQLVKTISDNRIRRRLIDSGKVDENTRFLFEVQKKAAVEVSSIKWGFVLIGIGLAIMVGQFFPSYASDEISAGLILMMAGIGFLLYYHVSKRILEQKGGAD